jgi:hypothetical protein
VVEDVVEFVSQGLSVFLTGFNMQVCTGMTGGDPAGREIRQVLLVR